MFAINIIDKKVNIDIFYIVNMDYRILDYSKSV